jgi:hypothetical protein
MGVLQWTWENGCEWSSATCALVAFGGHLEVLQWARENGCPWHSETCSVAAQEGHLGLMQWARANDCPWDKRSVFLRQVGIRQSVPGSLPS